MEPRLKNPVTENSLSPLSAAYVLWMTTDVPLAFVQPGLGRRILNIQWSIVAEIHVRIWVYKKKTFKFLERRLSKSVAN